VTRLLAVDTCFGACSVAVLDGERILAHRFEAMERGHAEALAPMVEAAMRESAIAYAALERLAVTTGPGTFTGQRVGLAFMRGLRVALKMPLIGVTSLEVMARQALVESGIPRAAALHDARRDEVYLGIVDEAPESIVEPVVQPFGDALRRLAALPRPLVVCGTAAPRAGEALSDIVLSGVRAPDALWVARTAMTRPIPDAPPRPLYLRAPDAKLPAPRP
jgi:tRNA threonylcarbamoyladenosine biosynthesis protein TsaB